MEAFSNYRVQEQEDPGEYRLPPSGQSNPAARRVRLAAQVGLLDRRDGAIVRFSVERTVALTPQPLPELPDDVRYAGYESRSSITLLEAPGGKCVGLWHLLQVPAGSTLVLPLRTPAPPVRYFNKGCWELHDRSAAPYLSWRYEGKANAKIGYGCAQVTGRAGALRRRCAGDWVLVILEFPVFRDMYYSDAVAPQQAGDQVFQAWDGFAGPNQPAHAAAVGRPARATLGRRKLLTSRERVLTTLNRREPDRVPIDCGGTICSTLTRSAHNAVKAHLGIRTPDEPVTHPVLDTVVSCEPLLARWEIDFRAVRMRPPWGTSCAAGHSSRPVGCAVTRRS